MAPGGSAPAFGNGWMISQWWQDASGHHVDIYTLSTRASDEGATDGFDAWLAQHAYTQGISYQPNGRFWHFQMVEAAGYVGLALVLAAATVWWVRRRAA